MVAQRDGEMGSPIAEDREEWRRMEILPFSFWGPVIQYT